MLQSFCDKLSDLGLSKNCPLQNFLALINEIEVNPGKSVLNLTNLKDDIINLLRSDKNLEKNTRIALKKFGCIFTLCRITETELKNIKPHQRSQSSSALDTANCIFKEVGERKDWSEKTVEENRKINKRLKQLRKQIEHTMFDP